MMKSNKCLIGLSAVVGVLATVVAGVGILWRSSGKEFTFTTVRGENVQIQGGGLYQYDTLAMAAQAVAQDAVTLAVGLPLLVVAILMYRRGSLRGQLLLTGTLGYFLYTYMSYSFTAAYNPLFLVYVALFGTSLYAFVLAMQSIDVAALPAHFSAKLPRWGLAALSMLIGGLIGLMWLGRIAPPLLNSGIPVGLESYTTLPIQAIDLGIVLPTAMLAGVLLLRGQAFGYLLTAVMLIKGFTLLTAISAMAVGQLLVGIQVNMVELIVFPALNLLVIAATTILLRDVRDDVPLAPPAPPLRPNSRRMDNGAAIGLYNFGRRTLAESAAIVYNKVL